MRSNKGFTHILLPISVVTLVFVAFNTVSGRLEVRDNNDFKVEMTKFANTGARFTALDGLELCDAINELKLNYEPQNKELIDCNRFDK